MNACTCRPAVNEYHIMYYTHSIYVSNMYYIKVVKLIKIVSLYYGYTRAYRIKWNKIIIVRRASKRYDYNQLLKNSRNFNIAVYFPRARMCTYTVLQRWTIFEPPELFVLAALFFSNRSCIIKFRFYYLRIIRLRAETCCERDYIEFDACSSAC